MFFDRLIRNIFIFLFIFVIGINIYAFSASLQFGTEHNYTYYGFYGFFKHFENMPSFDTFIWSINDISGVLLKWSGWRIGLAIATLGISEVSRVVVGFGEIVVCILIDVIRIIGWLLGFIGTNIDSPVLNQ